MTRVPAHPPAPDQVAKQIEIAVQQLIDLLARQVARETNEDAPDREETRDDGAQQSKNI